MEFFAISATKVNTASRYPKFFSSSSQPESKKTNDERTKGQNILVGKLRFYRKQKKS
jgi:hypothetical protein